MVVITIDSESCHPPDILQTRARVTVKVTGGTRFLDKIGNGTCNEKEDIGPSDMLLNLQTSRIEERRHFQFPCQLYSYQPLDEDLR